jgi:hypothetical protein
MPREMSGLTDDKDDQVMAILSVIDRSVRGLQAEIKTLKEKQDPLSL